MSTKIEDLILRLGNVQILTYWEGTGVNRSLRALITKHVPEAVLEVNPNARAEFTMEDLAALGKLCREATQQAIQRQSIDVLASRAATTQPVAGQKKSAKKRATKKATKKRSAKR